MEKELQRARREIGRLSGAAVLMGVVVVRVDEEIPLFVLGRARQRERERHLGAVQDEEEVVVHDRLSVRVDVADPAAAEKEPEAGGDGAVSISVGYSVPLVF